MRERLTQHYIRPEYIDRWVVAICLILLTVSGSAPFCPAPFWLIDIFDTP